MRRPFDLFKIYFIFQVEFQPTQIEFLAVWPASQRNHEHSDSFSDWSGMNMTQKIARVRRAVLRFVAPSIGFLESFFTGESAKV